MFHCSFILQVVNGAIKFSGSSASTKLLIESTLFDSCSSSTAGGSLYYTTGECIQEFVCYYNTSSLSSHQAFSTFLSSNLRNFAKFSSISRSGRLDKDRCINPDSSMVQIDNFNMSYVVGNGNPTYDIDGASANSFIQYTEFMNITQNYEGLCQFNYNNGADFKITNCNFLKNKGLKNPIGYLLFCPASTTVDNCCFKENNCQYAFYTRGTLIIKNSYYESSTTPPGQNIQFISPKNDKNAIPLFHLSLEKCFIENNDIKFQNSCYDNPQIRELIGYIAKSFYISVMIQI